MVFEAAEFIYDPEKNAWLKEKRGIGFDEIIALIANGHVIEILEHHNQARYPGQKICVLDVGGYMYLVPFESDDDKITLKTIYPSRKATREYLVTAKEN